MLNKFIKVFTIFCAISNVFGSKNCKLLSKLKATQDLESVAIKNKTTSQKVQMQYQDMPYPEFTMEQMHHERQHYGDNPHNKDVLHHMPTDVLSMINHYLYKGKETFSDGFRVLIAGGGTGNAVIFLAEQLRKTNAEVVYIDFSKASMLVAQERADIRQLKNIKWVNDKLENIPQLDLGKFDFIGCTGVLHHLPDPYNGLRILGNSLNEHGGMAIMVYGRYGRTGLYQAQDMVKLVNSDAEDELEMVDEILNVKTLFRAMSSSPLGFESFMRRLSSRNLETDEFYEKLTQPSKLFIGSIYNNEVYDRFCHSQDRAFSVPELEHWTRHAGLHFVDFNLRQDKFQLSVQNFDFEDDLRISLDKLNFLEKYAFSELFHGSFDSHNFYISKQNDSIASIEDHNNILYFYGKPYNVKEKLQDDLKTISEENHKIVSNLEFEISSFFNHGKFKISFPLTNYTKLFIDHFLEGKTSTGDLLTEIDNKYEISPELMMSELRDFYNNISWHDLFLLRDKNVMDIDVMRNFVLFRF